MVIEISPDLKQQLAVAAVRDRTTARAIILLALRAAGFVIPDEELRDKRTRSE